MSATIDEILIEKKQQYTVNNKVINNSKQYTVIETRRFIESLDRRVYKCPQYLPFYCKAARTLGFSRVIELQAMVVQDPRINQPSKFNAEKVFWSLLKAELLTAHN